VAGSPHSVSATYNPANANFLGSSPGSLSGGQTVNKATSSVTVTADHSPSSYLQLVTFTAIVTPQFSGMPTGSVQFFDGANPLGSAQTLSTVNGQQQVSLTVGNLSVGNHAITAKYQGDSNFTGKTSAVYNQFVKATTATALATSGSPMTYGQSITFTATVTITSPPLATLSGSVLFLDGNSQIGSQSVSLINGQYQAAFTTSTLTAATHTITAQYQGDSNYAGSTSNSVSEQINKASTTVTVASTNTNSVYGEAAITATVSPQYSGTPTGNVTFTVFNTVTHATSTEQDALVSGVATLSLLTPGSYQISASYAGDSNFTGNNSNTINQTVSQASTAAQLSSSANPSVFGQPVILTATISVVAPGSGSPTGTVTFFNGTTPLGNPVSVQKVGNNYQASVTVSNLAVGNSQSFSAQYSGDSNFFGATSNTLAQTVNPAPTLTAVTASLTQVPYGLPVTFTATVTVPSPGAGTAQGTVTFFDGTTAIKQLPLQTVNGQQQASFTTQPIDLTIGTHQITAVYTDTVDNNFATSTSSVLNVTVNPDATSTTVTSTPMFPVVNRSVSFTAVVTTNSPTLVTPSGNVLFTVDNTQQTVALTNGQATLTLASGLPLGNHFVTAAFQGTSNFLASTSPTLTVTVLTPNQGFVAQAYQDLLHRAVDPGGLAFWSGLLNQGAISRTQLAASIEASTEYRSDVVDALYLHYLHRHADSGGLAFFVPAMAGGMTDEQVAAILAGSPEYYNNRGGGTVNGFLTALYSDTLHRAVDPQGLQSFTQALSFNVSRQQVAATILGSPEYEQDLVINLYNEFLRRNPDLSGLAFWSSALAHGVTDEFIIAQLVGSDEYYNNA
jgi:hypothetical protein